MAYKTEDLERDALKVIKEKELAFIKHIVPFLPCDKSTFYAHNLHESDTIKESIEKNRVSKKLKLQSKWMDSDNATTQIALYKLLSDESELRALSGQHIDHTTGGDKLQIVINKNYNEQN